MRVTNHSARFGKNGVFLANHNDRTFNLDKAEHIDQERTINNKYWHLYNKSNPELTFMESELKFYRNKFFEGLNAKNLRYIKQRHFERTKTIEQLYKDKNSCPEEMIFQIGNSNTGNINSEELLQIYTEFCEWRKKAFPNIVVLNYALHDDEYSPHIHERISWIAHDKHGFLIPSQNKALQEMNIQRPNPEKPLSRFNNPKISYSESCRTKIIELCKNHNLDITTTPQEASKVGLTLMEFKRQQEANRSKKLQRSIKKKENVLSALNNKILDYSNKLSELTNRYEKTKLLIKEQEDRLKELHTAEQNLRNLLKPAEKQLIQINERREQQARRRLREIDDEISLD